MAGGGGGEGPVGRRGHHWSSFNWNLDSSVLHRCHSASNCPASTWGSFISMTTSGPHRARIAQNVLEGRKGIIYLTTHATHFIYGYMASDIW